MNTPVEGTTKYRSVSRTSYDNSAVVARDYIVYSKDSSGILNRTEGTLSSSLTPNTNRSRGHMTTGSTELSSSAGFTLADGT